MKKITQPLAAYLLAGCILASCQPDGPNPDENSRVQTETQNNLPQVEVVQTSASKIQLALILDTSGSMSGLIEQAKQQLWKIVLELAKTKAPDGKDPQIEIALYHYGNDGLSLLSGYVQQLVPLTSELDDISEQLFALGTNGGEEYCGTVINTSLNELEWSKNPEDLKLIYIAGNEGFDQGLFSYAEACAKAVNHDVIVNTIFCGDRNTGISQYWQDGAIRGKGNYAFINSNQQTVHYNTPYDDEISSLNRSLNQTYISYNWAGNHKKVKQIAEDAKAEAQGSAYASKRFLSKGSKVYKNATWDLVDASKEKDFSMEKIEKEALPDSLQNLNETELKIKIEELNVQRNKLKNELSDLNIKRSEYIASIKDSTAQENPLEQAIIDGLRNQANQKGFTFQEAIN
jgi:hypothetical protein